MWDTPYIMSLQLVRTSSPEPDFALKMAKLDIYCAITGKTRDDCMNEALDDYISVVVAAKLSQFEKFVEENGELRLVVV